MQVSRSDHGELAYISSSFLLFLRKTVAIGGRKKERRRESLHDVAAVNRSERAVVVAAAGSDGGSRQQLAAEGYPWARLNEEAFRTSLSVMWASVKENRPIPPVLNPPVEVKVHAFFFGWLVTFADRPVWEGLLCTDAAAAAAAAGEEVVFEKRRVKYQLRRLLDLAGIHQIELFHASRHGRVVRKRRSSLVRPQQDRENTTTKPAILSPHVFVAPLPRSFFFVASCNKVWCSSSDFSGRQTRLIGHPARLRDIGSGGQGGRLPPPPLPRGYLTGEPTPPAPAALILSSKFPESNPGQNRPQSISE